jgi:hypothetical protein
MIFPTKQSIGVRRLLLPADTIEGMAISPGPTKLLTAWCILRAAYTDFLDHSFGAGRKMRKGEGITTTYSRMGQSSEHGNREYHYGQFLQHISPPGFLPRLRKGRLQW